MGNFRKEEKVNKTNERDEKTKIDCLRKEEKSV
jgi:hypothetical protein